MNKQISVVNSCYGCVKVYADNALVWEGRAEELLKTLENGPELVAETIRQAHEWMLDMDFAPDYRLGLVAYLAQEAKKFRSW